VTVGDSRIYSLRVVRVRFANPADVSIAVLEVSSAEVVALDCRALVLHAEGRSIEPREIVEGVCEATCNAQVSLAVGVRSEGRRVASVSQDV
jgi:hypothetical protein